MAKAEYDFVRHDGALYAVLLKADEDELRMLAETLARRRTSKIVPSCRDPAELTRALQRMGGHGIANVVRGHGLAYEHIVSSVAKFVKADVTECRSVADQEWRVVERLVDQAVDKMDSEQKERFEEELKQHGAKAGWRSIKRDLLLRNPQLQMLILMTVVRQILVRLGVKFIAGRTLTVLTGPVGWVVGTIWLAIEVARPAYSVTVPGVLLVAMMRARQAAEAAAREVVPEN